jgi:hypothetical protein
MARTTVLAVALTALVTLPLPAQQIPTSQPTIVDISRELEKPGHFAAHEAVEARWAALNRQHNYPHTYLALSAVSGTPEVWWVTPYTGMDAFGKAWAFGSNDASFMQALSKIAMEDGEHLVSFTRMQAAALPEASYGTFPEVAKIRVYSILTVQMRPGHEAAFTDIAKRYAAMMKSKSVPASWRAYEVIAGAPSGTFLVFESYPSWEAVETGRKAAAAAFMGTNPADLEGIMKASRESVMNTNSRYFVLNPRMSLVPKELMASDPFWAPKP